MKSQMGSRNRTLGKMPIIVLYLTLCFSIFFKGIWREGNPSNSYNKGSVLKQLYNYSFFFLLSTSGDSPFWMAKNMKSLAGEFFFFGTTFFKVMRWRNVSIRIREKKWSLRAIFWINKMHASCQHLFIMI